MKQIVTFLAGTSLLLVVSASFLVTPTALAAPGSTLPHVLADAKSDACAGIGLAGGGCGDNGAALNKALAAVITIFSAVVGIAAVIMVIIAGLRFITSSGDTSKVAGAKSAIIYAIIGLIIVAIAQSLVHFVLLKVK